MKKNKKLKLGQQTLRQLTPVDLTAANGGTYGTSVYVCTSGCPTNTHPTYCGMSCGSCYCPSNNCPTKIGCPSWAC